MPTFTYIAANNQGELLRGDLETVDIKAVTDYLLSQDLMVISVKPEKVTMASKLDISLFGLTAQDKIMITSHLAMIVKAGLSLKEGVDIILNDAKKGLLKRILTETKFNLEKGQPLSATFKNHPNIFSPVFVAMIEAGEISGTLDRALEYLGIQLAKEYELGRKIKGAMTYPLILIVASIAVIAVLMIVVMPKLTKVFIQSNIALPWTTRLIISASKIINENTFLLAALAAFFLFSFSYFRKTDRGQGVISEILLKTPVVKDLYKKIIIARFTRTLGTLLKSGVGILRSLDIAAETLGLSRYQKSVIALKEEVSRGVSVGNALKNSGVFPHLIMSMVSVGEKTGKLDSVLIDLADFYEKEVDNDLRSVVALIEPVLLLIMGIIVAAIAFSIIVPIYQLVGSVR